MTVFANGTVVIDQDSAEDSWTRSKTAVLPFLPPERRVLGIACQNKNAEYGILAELNIILDVDNQIKVLTDYNWLCSSKFVTGWNLPGFVDTNSDFSPAKRGNSYRNGWFPDPIDKAAEVIWGTDQSAGSWAYCKQSFPGPKLHAACDDHMTVYVDGSVLIEPIYDRWGWKTPNIADIPLGTQVIGIKCEDKGGDYGIVASLSNGIVTDTDGSWSCSSKYVPEWNLPGFVDKDSDFSPAKDGNAYKNEFRPGSIAKTSKVIWGPDRKPYTSAYCRFNVAAPDCNCGLAKRSTRIVGGVLTEVNEYPWQVGIVTARSTSVWCGGSLISNSWVLTAAHCTKGESASGIEVLLGEHNYDDQSETNMVRMGISSIKNHPDYIVNGRTPNYDFSLLKMKNTISFSDYPHIRPICLPVDASNDYTGSVATVTGWGRQSSGAVTGSNILREVDVVVLSNSDCKNNYGYSSNRITSQMLCANVQGGGKDSCQGDSGGPLVTAGSGDGVSVGGNYELIGVVSWGEGCAQANSPGVYARVTEQLEWIKETTKQGWTTCPRE